jgi:fumarylacetoacetate (FAA) hydrolase family protein
MRERLTVEHSLPADRDRALLVGRAWKPGPNGGPCIIAVRGAAVVDLTASFATMADLLDSDAATVAAKVASAPVLGDLAAVLANSAEAGRDTGAPWLLAPCDLQAIKAAGVTFAASMLERVIEERARGDAGAAAETRRVVTQILGDDLSKLEPGSEAAMRLKAALIERAMWSQYLEVGIGPDAEIFTKAPAMAAVGHGAAVGIHPKSSWNNPEPEIVLAVNSRGVTVGATLGNDVNLRDVEGRSALLLGKAKDNNASCAIGPFIRLFDQHFTIDDVRKAEVELVIEGTDNFRLEGRSAMSKISRDPLDLAAQTIGDNHQYPDGFVLFLGTMFAPVQDRDEPGSGFTHKRGDVVTIATARLGRLVNVVTTSDQAPRWTFGARALMRNLAQRGLLK